MSSHEKRHQPTISMGEITHHLLRTEPDLLQMADIHAVKTGSHKTGSSFPLGKELLNIASDCQLIRTVFVGSFHDSLEVLDVAVIDGGAAAQDIAAAGRAGLDDLFTVILDLLRGTGLDL